MSKRLTEQEIIERLQWINNLYEKEGRLPLWNSTNTHEKMMHDWIKTTQNRYNAEGISEKRLSLIKQHSLVVYNKIVGNTDSIWVTNYKTFVKWVNDNARYPSVIGDSEEKRLNRWMANNRRFYKQGSLSPEKIDMINRIHPSILNTNDPIAGLNEHIRYSILSKHAKNEDDALYNKGISKSKLDELIRLKIFTITDIINIIRMESYNRKKGNGERKEHSEKLNEQYDISEHICTLGLNRKIENNNEPVLINDNVRYAVYKTLDNTLKELGEIRLLQAIFGEYTVIFDMCYIGWKSQGTFLRIRNLSNMLNKRQREVFKRRYIENKTLRQIGNELGVSGSYIGQVDSSIIRYYRNPENIQKIKGTNTDSIGLNVV